MLILALDIGGTNSRIGHFSLDAKGSLSLVDSLWLKTADYASFEELMEDAASKFSLSPAKADMLSAAIAGPVIGGTTSAPPLIGWQIDITKAAKRFNQKKYLLMNDFVAQAYSCVSQPGRQARRILSGTPEAGCTISVIGAGTGLGAGILVTSDDGRYKAIPSEGGHADFPFIGKRELEYQRFLTNKLPDEYITANVVVSGQGISLLHEFLTSEVMRPRDITERFDEFTETHEWASKFYGRLSRNFALQTLSTGGFYIAGGVAAKVPELLDHREFEAAFRSSPKHAELMGRMPVSLITDELSGLWGAASGARSHLGIIKRQ